MSVSANEPINCRYRYGCAIGYGNQFAWNVPYQYDVWLYSFNYHYTLLGNPNRLSLEVAVQPQFNSASFYEVKQQQAYELGMNVGLLLRRQLEDFSIYTMLGAGPHYVSNVPNRQASGFIFSDNLMIGGTYTFMPQVAFDCRLGVRHISNAGLKVPNGCINNSILQLGIFYIPN